VQATWVGHSTFLVQLEGLNFLTDPIFSQRCRWADGPLGCRAVEGGGGWSAGAVALLLAGWLMLPAAAPRLTLPPPALPTPCPPAYVARCSGWVPSEWCHPPSQLMMPSCPGWMACCCHTTTTVSAPHHADLHWCCCQPAWLVNRALGLPSCCCF
jgi:hypothetical protein